MIVKLSDDVKTTEIVLEKKSKLIGDHKEGC